MGNWLTREQTKELRLLHSGAAGRMRPAAGRACGADDRRDSAPRGPLGHRGLTVQGPPGRGSMPGRPSPRSKMAIFYGHSQRAGAS